MTILNQLDTGASHPWPNWSVGQTLGSVLVERAKTIYYARGRKTFSQQASFWVQAWQGFGSGAAARSMQARLYLLAQLEELAGNPDLQPVYIRWTQTADPSAPYTASELHDGWYNISDFQADYRNYVVTGPVKVALTVERVAPPPPARLAYGYAVAPLATTYLGSNANPVTLIGFPLNSSYPGPVVSRTAAEGALIAAASPTGGGSALLNPVLFGPSATIGDWFLGGVHAYDTVSTGSNPVPSSVGTFVNANWVEVLHPDRAYQGDAFVTNGLLGLLIQAGQARLCQCYLWNTALVGGAAWQLLGELRFASVSQVNCTCLGYSLDRLGAEEASITATMTGAGAATTQAVTQVQMRLQRFARLARLAITGQTESYASGSGNGLYFVSASSGKMIVYNPSAAGDAQVETIAFTAPNTANDGYGWAGAFFPDSTTPYHVGFLYQGQGLPLKQPQTLTSPTDTVYLADGPAFGATKYNAFYAFPFPTPQNAQAEGESGTLGTGWTSVADGGSGASGGNAAKCASGTASGNADLFGAAWQPPQNSASQTRYIAAFRVRVTSTAGATPEMTLGLWDATASAYFTNGSTTFKASDLGSVGYHWLVVGGNPANPITPTTGHNARFRAVTAATLGTDWFVDQAVLLPVSRSNLTTAFPVADQDFPLDLYLQFLGDRDARLVNL